MNLSEFTLTIQNFDPNHSKSNDQLEKITKIYPYFQTAFFFHVKSLQHQEKIYFDNILEKTAVLTYDRTLLMNWINKKIDFKPRKLKVKKEISLIKPKEDKKYSIKSEKVKSINLNTKKLSFSEWISISQKQIFNNAESTKKNNFENWSLINSFLENNTKTPSVKKNSSSSDIDLSYRNNFSDEELMTETLAKIFVKQEKFDKALQAYRILSLKYPEKNGLFALQIVQIKKILNKKNKI